MRLCRHKLHVLLNSCIRSLETSMCRENNNAQVCCGETGPTSQPAMQQWMNCNCDDNHDLIAANAENLPMTID